MSTDCVLIMVGGCEGEGILNELLMEVYVLINLLSVVVTHVMLLHNVAEIFNGLNGTLLSASYLNE